MNRIQLAKKQTAKWFELIDPLYPSSWILYPRLTCQLARIMWNYRNATDVQWGFKCQNLQHKFDIANKIED